MVQGTVFSRHHLSLGHLHSSPHYLGGSGTGRTGWPQGQDHGPGKAGDGHPGELVGHCAAVLLLPEAGGWGQAARLSQPPLGESLARLCPELWLGTAEAGLGLSWASAGPDRSARPGPQRPAAMSDYENEDECWSTLEGFRVKLISVIDPARITPYLRQCKVLNPDDEEQVLSDPSLVIRKRKVGQCCPSLTAGSQRRGGCRCSPPGSPARHGTPRHPAPAR